MLDEAALADLGNRKAPAQWVAVDTAPPPKPKRRFKKVIKREVAAAAKAAVKAALDEAEASGSARPSTKAELADMTKQALAATYMQAYQRVKLKKEARDPTVQCLGHEVEDGNVEYKLRLKDHNEGNPYRIQQLITQMKFRLAEGAGEAFYYIGVEDDGYPKGLEDADLQKSTSTLHHMARALGAAVSLVRKIPGTNGRTCALMRVRMESSMPALYVDLRVAVSGGVDSGKSSLVAVLTHGSGGQPLLDNGRGSARMSVLRHKHELESGRTSSISQQVLGYDEQGEVLNYGSGAALTPGEICSRASRLLTFIDMGGHERSLKTCLWGMTCLLPDYAVLCVCAIAGLGRMSREHLAVAVALEIPVAVVLTKCDQASAYRLEAVLAEVRSLLALAVLGLRPEEAAGEQQSVEALTPLIETTQQAESCARVLCLMRACPSLGDRGEVCIPVFATSAVSGAGLQLLHSFFSSLKPEVDLRQASFIDASSRAPPPAASNSTSAPFAVSQAEASLASASDGSLPNTATAAAAAARTGLSSIADTSMQIGFQPLGSRGASESSSGDTPLKHVNVGVAPAPAAAASLHASGHTSEGLRRVDSGGATAGLDEPVMFQVDQTFDINNVGSVVCGTVVQGTIRVDQCLVLGPNQDGCFLPVTVTGIQRLHTPVDAVRAGQMAALAVSQTGEPTSTPSGAMHRSPDGLAACEVALGAAEARQQGSDSLPGSRPLPSTAAGGNEAAPTAAEAGGGGGGAAAAAAAAAAAVAGVGVVAAFELPSEPTLALSPVLSVSPRSGADAAGTQGAAAAVGNDLDDLFAALGSFDEEDRGQENGRREQGAASQSTTGGTAGGRGGTGGGGGDLDDVFAGLGAFDEEAAAGRGVEVYRRGGGGAGGELQEEPSFAFGGLTSEEASAAPPSVGLASGVRGGARGGGGVPAARGKQQQQQPHLCGSDKSRLARDVADRVGQQRQDEARWRLGPVSGASSSSIGGGGGGAARGEKRGEVPDWLLECELATSPPAPSFLNLAASPPNSHKGAVLLDATLAQGTLWEFEAVVVLLGGRWPARGLLSGRWPPLDDASDTLSASSARAPEHLVVVHCGSVRQAAKVVSMQELESGGSGSAGIPELDSRRYCGLRATAAILQHQLPGSAAQAGLVSGGAGTRGGGVSGQSSGTAPGTPTAAATAAAAAGEVAQAAFGAGVVARAAGRGAGAPPAAQVHAGLRAGSSASASSSGLLASQWSSGTGRSSSSSSSSCSGPRGCSGTSDGELELEEGAGDAAGDGRGPAALRMRGGGGRPEQGGVASRVHSGALQQDLGCIVRMTLRFESRPEWLRRGNRLIVRDRCDGNIAGAGFIGAHGEA